MAGDPAREAWALMFELGMANRARLLAALARLDLTFMQAKALQLLRPGEERAMGDLAEALLCDASNVTGIIDRLEARGLVERRSSHRDRRVKAIALTSAGAELRERARAAFDDPPPSIQALPAADQRALRDILRRALAR